MKIFELGILRIGPTPIINKPYNSPTAARLYRQIKIRSYRYPELNKHVSHIMT